MTVANRKLTEARHITSARPKCSAKGAQRGRRNIGEQVERDQHRTGQRADGAADELPMSCQPRMSRMAASGMPFGQTSPLYWHALVEG
ncbi:hypothetical protein [Silanimonas sp.]|jgi:hypothetical protein|uniref:hypothetical protein n=1 Tax=Silanimonas sp. TaxID=1929290 RepID=UPI0022CA22F8|nr:hypothetical protein [Silanimonas sp.]MCZ8167092.1 hypothetical protein [Silanimonas sp.]